MIGPAATSIPQRESQTRVIVTDHVTKTDSTKAESLKPASLVVGTSGLEPLTPTVSIRFPAPRKTRNASLRRSF